MALTLNTTLIPGVTIITDDTSGGIAIDYSTVLSNINTNLTNINNNLTNVNTNLTNINTTSGTIKTSIDTVTTELSTLNTSFSEQSDPTEIFTSIAESLEKVSLTVAGEDEGLSPIERIADSLETSDSTSLADNLQSMVIDINTIKVLAETTGIKTISPHRWMELVAVYKYLVDDGTVLQPASVTPEQVEQAKEKMVEFLDKIKDLPTGTD